MSPEIAPTRIFVRATVSRCATNTYDSPSSSTMARRAMTRASSKLPVRMRARAKPPGRSRPCASCTSSVTLNVPLARSTIGFTSDTLAGNKTPGLESTSIVAVLADVHVRQLALGKVDAREQRLELRHAEALLALEARSRPGSPCGR